MTEETLEAAKDTFIGSKFGKDGQVEVLCVAPKSDKHQRYIVYCHTCSRDSELYGDGKFEAIKGNLLRGAIPCGCSEKGKLSREQWEVVATRECREVHVDLLGIGEFKGSRTSLSLRCQLDGHVWHTRSISNLMSKGAGCPECAKVAVSFGVKVPDDVAIGQFEATGAFVVGTTFRPIGERSLQGWQIDCPKCREDIYTKSGLCTGQFKSNRCRLLSGSIPCRCSKKYRWTEEQRQFQIEAIIEEKCLPYTFVGWKDLGGYKWMRSKFTLMCPIYGEFDKTFAGFVDKGALHPPKYSREPSANAHIYVINASGQVGGFTGYGISTVLQNRLCNHRRALKKASFSITEKTAFETTWKTALEVEAILKFKFDRFPQEVLGFLTEATHQRHYQDVVNFVQKYLENEKLILSDEGLKCTMAN